MNTNVKASILRRLITTAVLGTLASNFAVATDAVYTDSKGFLKETVRFGDLNIGTPQGAAVLYGRIRLAAARVCWPLDHGDLASKLHVEACANRAIVEAVNAVNQPALIAVYNTKNRLPLPAVASAERNR